MFLLYFAVILAGTGSGDPGRYGAREYKQDYQYAGAYATEKACHAAAALLDKLNHKCISSNTGEQR